MAFLNENEWILLNETAYNISFIYTVEEMQKEILTRWLPFLISFDGAIFSRLQWDREGNYDFYEPVMDRISPETQHIWVEESTQSDQFRWIMYASRGVTFRESIKQRRRWTSGTLQIAGEWLPVLGRRLAERPSIRPLDMGATMLIPAYQAAALISMGLTALAAGFVHPGEFSLLLCLGYIAGNLLITVLGATLSAVLVITVENKWDRRLLPALAVYWFFLLSWVVLTVGCIFKKTTVWEEICHTRNVSLPKGSKMKRSNQVLAP